MKFSQLTDKFTGTKIDASKWSVSGESAVGGDKLQLSAIDQDSSTLDSSARYDLTSDSVKARMEIVGYDPESTRVYFTVKNSAGDFLEIVLLRGKLRFRKHYRLQYSETDVYYNPTVHVWWKISEFQGTISWATSVDGLSWTVQRTTAEQMNVHSMQFEIRLEQATVSYGFGFGAFGRGPFGG